MSNDGVRFKCPFCGQMLEGSPECVDTEGECPTCGKNFLLKATGAMSEEKPNCLKCYLEMFRRYVGFTGRTRRREFWWALFLNLVAYFIAAIFDVVISDDEGGIVVGVYFLMTLLPMLALQVRRLHDTSKSGWWVLLLTMPVLNIACIVWFAMDGDKGRNRFGDDPKGRV